MCGQRSEHGAPTLSLLLVNAGAGAVDGSMFGAGVGPIYLGQLFCNGSESSLVDCPLPSFGLFSPFCNHENDAGVICRGEEVGGEWLNNY